MYFNSGPSEVVHPVRSTGTEGEALGGSLITVVSVVNGAKEKTTRESTTALISDPPSCPNLDLTSKLVEMQVQTQNPSQLSNSLLDADNKMKSSDSCHAINLNLTSSQPPPVCSSERSSTSELLFNISVERQSLTPLTDCNSSNEESSNSDLGASSPDPDGYVTPSFPIGSYNYALLTVPHVPYTGYTAITIPASLPQPPLPEKQRTTTLQNVADCIGANSLKSDTKLFTSSGLLPVINELLPVTKCKVAPSNGVEEPESRLSSKFVQDSSKYWYKPGISRDQGKSIGVCILSITYY